MNIFFGAYLPDLIINTFVMRDSHLHTREILVRICLRNTYIYNFAFCVILMRYVLLQQHVAPRPLCYSTPSGPTLCILVDVATN